MPSAFAQTKRVGCRVFDWHGRRVSLVCFALSEQKVAHMFIIERSVLRDVPSNYPVQVEDRQGGVTTAAWTDETNTYVVALQDDGDELRRVFL